MLGQHLSSLNNIKQNQRHDMTVGRIIRRPDGWNGLTAPGTLGTGGGQGRAKPPTPGTPLRGNGAPTADFKQLKVQSLDELSDDQLLRKLAVLTEMAKPLLTRLPAVIDAAPVGADVGAETNTEGEYP
jgi:hypothetical protein